jgi:hypothetical protein
MHWERRVEKVQMRFLLKDSNRFYLPGTRKRFLHLASVNYGLREYVCFADRLTIDIYIEEITGGCSPQLVEDDKLVEAIEEFLKGKGILDMNRPLIPDQEWYRRKVED